MSEVGDTRGVGGAGSFSFTPRDCYNALGHKKQTYETRKAANIGKRLWAKKRGGSTEGLEVYRCSTCKKYHVGHSKD